MKLEDIGFYTLRDERAANVSLTSPLSRCELILTDRCNFRCPYCMGVEEKYAHDLSLTEAKNIVKLWADDKLQNVRFSGGEPTIWRGLPELIGYTKSLGVKRIAISTNGSKSLDYYYSLMEVGVDDFSISLDACCASTGDTMLGGIRGMWKKVTDNIKALAKKAYVTVGVVFTEENVKELTETIRFASEELGVSDIRIISAAQWNKTLKVADIPKEILDKNPILKYRVQNFNKGRNVRGIGVNDNHQCPLVIDDMAVMNGYHFPCIIYLRQHGEPIGKMEGSIEKIRQERFEWYKNHNTFEDSICKRICLDVCVDYNNRVRELNQQMRK